MRNKSNAFVTIANGAALSEPVNLGDKVLCAIVMPAAWTAACLSFQASEDNGATWYSVYDDAGNEVTIPLAAVAVSRRISVDPSTFCGIDLIKLRSGTTATPVNQAAAATLELVARKFYALN